MGLVEFLQLRLGFPTDFHQRNKIDQKGQALLPAESQLQSQRIGHRKQVLPGRKRWKEGSLAQRLVSLLV